jgi:hypothetical protein
MPRRLLFLAVTTVVFVALMASAASADPNLMCLLPNWPHC